MVAGAVADWAIEAGAEAIGGVGLMAELDGDAEAAEIGYWLGEPFWGRGIATDAVTALTRHALRPLAAGGLGYGRLFALVRVENVGSCRVLEKAGYTAEATLSRPDPATGDLFAQVIYAGPGGRNWSARGLTRFGRSRNAGVIDHPRPLA